MNCLSETFHHHFDMVSADTPGLIENAYKLRYQVYCVERRYEEADKFPDQMEFDEYDFHSRHSLIKSKNSGGYVGLVRLVLPSPVNPDAPLPMEKICNAHSIGSDVDLSDISRQSIAEISRFSVSKELRRRCVTSAHDVAVDKAMEKSVPETQGESGSSLLPHITLGLFASIVRMSAQNNITHWLAVMEPTLIRFLTRYGIHFQPTGSLVDYHGMRQPAIAEIDKVLSGIHALRKDVWEFITDNGRVWPLTDTPIQVVAAR